MKIPERIYEIAKQFQTTKHYPDNIQEVFDWVNVGDRSIFLSKYFRANSKESRSVTGIVVHYYENCIKAKRDMLEEILK